MLLSMIFRAQQLIEQRRIQKMQEAKEEEKRKELERRQLGKNLQVRVTQHYTKIVARSY